LKFIEDLLFLVLMATLLNDTLTLNKRDVI
jgi:hypothetical protein